LVNKVGIEKIIVFLIKYKFAIDRYIFFLKDIGLNKNNNTIIARLSIVISIIIFVFTSIIK
jgi:hypothetical protein